MEFEPEISSVFTLVRNLPEIILAVRTIHTSVNRATEKFDQFDQENPTARTHPALLSRGVIQSSQCPIKQWERSLPVGHVPLEQHGGRTLPNVQLDIGQCQHCFD